MNHTETVLLKKLTESEPTLDLLGADRKVFQVAFQDLTYYLNFIENMAYKQQNEKSQAKSGKEDASEFESFLVVWTGLWLRKWKERFNLLIGKNSQNQNKSNGLGEATAKGESLWTELDCKEELIGLVISTLIKNSEICGVKIIAEHILKTELGKKIDQDINSKEQTLEIFSNTLRRTREIAQKNGPLISIKVEKNYYLHAKM